MSALPVRLVAPSKPQPQPIDLSWARVEEFFKAKSLSPNSVRAYRTALKRFSEWVNRPWPEVTPRMVAMYRDTLREARLKPASINRLIYPISAFYRWMAKAYPELNLKNPCEAIEPEKVPSPPAQDLLPDEVAALWEVVFQRPIRDQAIVALLCHGLRASEVVGLDIRDFDGERVTIRQAKDDSTGVVPLSPAAAEIVQALAENREPSEALFLGAKQNRLSYSSVYKIVMDCGLLAGIPTLHPHRLRHTFATQIVLAGIDPQHAMTLTRHSSTEAFQRYWKRAQQTAAEKAFRVSVGEIIPGR